ncbi:Protein of unknown function [Gryllus bimaculatus]|nr:Protein of unknown function [Gryllus bimaculatus]
MAVLDSRKLVCLLVPAAGRPAQQQQPYTMMVIWNNRQASKTGQYNSKLHCIVEMVYRASFAT